MKIARCLPWIYPLLFAANEVFNLLAVNPEYVRLGDVARLVAVLLAATLTILVALYLLWKDTHRAALAALLALACFGRFGVIIALLGARFGLDVSMPAQLALLTVWCGLFSLPVSNWIWKRVKAPHTITGYLTVLTAALLGLSLFRIYQYQASLIQVDSLPTWPVPTLKPAAASGRPDIYHIVVDGYGRADVLQALYGFDNQPFLAELKARGFYIAEESHANYMQTGLSLSSMLNLNYLPALPAGSLDRSPLSYWVHNSAARQALEQAGYESVSFTSGYYLTEIRDADLFLNPTHRSNQGGAVIEALYLTNSMASLLGTDVLLDSAIDTYGDRQEMEHSHLQSLETLASRPGPQYVFLHLVIPHPPFIYDEHGPINPDKQVTLRDSPEFQGGLEKYQSGYRGQVAYVNQLILQAVDTLLQHSEQPPVIILHGDHGPGMLLDWASASSTCVWERSSILSAYYLPGDGAQALYPSISLVNAFRVVFDAYFQTDLGLISDEPVYYSTWAQPYQLIDVTARQNEPCQP